MITVRAYDYYGLDMSQINITNLLYENVNYRTSFNIEFLFGINSSDYFSGTGFSYDSSGLPISGTIYNYRQILNNHFYATVDGMSVPVTTFVNYVLSGDNLGAISYILSGNDSIIGGINGDYLMGYIGSDTVSGGSGNDTIDGGGGNNYLRGDDGNDYIFGGSDFDDINGNKGEDTIGGGPGGDWLVGGQGNDLITSTGGSDILYGNLGNDTLNGGPDNDLIRGGQGDDVLSGGSGNDWLSGDRGSDTFTGGAGADIFHTFGDAGIDRVIDFNLSEGDRVQLDPGTVYTVSQVGADTVINMTGGGQMILVGVQMSTLTSGWIFGA